jgi:nucleoside-diphosphate-sugar epimerase
MAKVVITGANGFLGSNLCTFFVQKGWQVNALVHRLPQVQIPGISYCSYELSGNPDEKYFEGADYFIHCAYARATKGQDAYHMNIEGTKKLLEASRKYGIKNIFISSVAARKDALSVYGKQKYACEGLFNRPSDLILRPGLILGNGGLFGQMREYLQKSRLIPLISGGKQPMQTINVNDVAIAIEKCLQKELSGTLILASSEKLTTKEFYKFLCKSIHTRPIFISIPYSILYFCLSISESIGFTLPVSRENLLGLKKIDYIDSSQNLATIGISIKDCQASLDSIKC